MVGVQVWWTYRCGGRAGVGGQAGVVGVQVLWTYRCGGRAGVGGQAGVVGVQVWAGKQVW